MLPSDEMAQSDRGVWGVPPIRGWDFHPFYNVALAIRVGLKGPKCCLQASAGQPPYLAEAPGGRFFS